MKHPLLIFFFFVFLCNTIFAQSSSVDSLLTLVKLSKEDTNKVNLLSKLGKKLASLNDFERSDKYFLQAKRLAEKLNFKKGIAFVYRNLGINNFEQSNYAKALDDHSNALKNYEAIHDSLGISACYNNIGLAYMMGQANYPKALEYYLRGLKIKELIHDEPGIYKSYMNIGEIYYFQENHTLALRYYFKALYCAKKLGDQVSEARCYMNIGVAYENQKSYDKALEYQLKSLRLCEKLNDQQSIGKCYGNIGNIYFYNKDYKKALDYELKSLAFKEALQDKASISDCLNNIGETYIALNNYEKANEYYLKALKIKNEINDNYGLRGCYAGLASVNAFNGHFKEAYFYEVKFKKLNDSLFNIENSKQLGDLKTNFEVEKKSTELKIKSELEKEKLKAITLQEKKVQQIITSAIVGVLLIVLVFSFFLFKRFKLTNKQKEIIEIKNAETEAQKHLVEEKQKEIISSITYAKRLQNAILPPQDFIDSHLSDNFVYYQPKDIIAGDFYWMYVNNDKVFVAAADSTGHGVPGAMVSIVCSNALEKAVKEFGLTDTGKILDKTTDLVLETFAKSGDDIKDGMDISLLAIDKKNKKVNWSGANNPLWFIIPPHTLIGKDRLAENDILSIKEIKPDKQPIGKSDNRKPFTTHKIDYQPNTIFYLMTDGYADQFGGSSGKKYKYKQLEEKLISICSKSLIEQKQLLFAEFTAWKGNLEQVDDVTIIGIKI